MEFSKSFTPVPRITANTSQIPLSASKVQKKTYLVPWTNIKAFSKSKGAEQKQRTPRLTFEWNLKVLEERKLVHDEAIKKKKHFNKS